jgi:hypothetical protein
MEKALSPVILQAPRNIGNTTAPDTAFVERFCGGRAFPGFKSIQNIRHSKQQISFSTDKSRRRALLLLQARGF